MVGEEEELGVQLTSLVMASGRRLGSPDQSHHPSSQERMYPWAMLGGFLGEVMLW